MKALNITQYTGIAGLQYQDVPEPTPGAQRRRERPCRARVQAPRARPAPVRRERRARRELRREHQRAQEKEGAEPRVEQVRVLAEPAEPRAPREVALEDRAGVGVGLPGHARA